MVAHRQLESVQALRGIAAVLVMLYHSGTLYAVHVDRVLWSNVFRAGFSGVDGFFVLSGLVIYWVHGGDIGQPSRGRHFAVKRAFRLLPVYWTVVLLKVLKDLAALSLSTFAVAWTLWPTPQPFVNVSWTLTYEVYFYALFWLWIVLPRGPLRWLPAVALLGPPLLALLQVPAPASDSVAGAAWGFLANGHLFEFGFGVVVGWWLRRFGTPAATTSAALAIGGALAFASAAVLATVWAQHTAAQSALTAFEAAATRGNAVLDAAVWTFGLPAAAAIAGVVGLELAGRWRLPWRSALAWVGDISYSLYLVHGFVIHLLLSQGAFRRLATEHPAALSLAWAVSMLLAWLSYRLIELPAMGLGRRLAMGRAR